MANPLMSMMKNNSPLQRIIMNQMKHKNPELYNALENGANPQELVKNKIKNLSSEQIEKVSEQAKAVGVPDEIIQELKNLKK